MPTRKTQVRRKSLHRSANAKRAKKFRAMRAAKERKRIERAQRDEPMPDVSHVIFPPGKPSGFRVSITCLDDGERVSFTAHRTPWGSLSVSPTLAGRKVACVLKHYRELTPHFNFAKTLRNALGNSHEA